MKEWMFREGKWFVHRTLLTFGGLCPRDKSKFKDFQALKSSIRARSRGLWGPALPMSPFGCCSICWTQLGQEFSMLGSC